MLTDILSPIRSYRRLLLKFWTLRVFELLSGGSLGATYDVYRRLIGKRVVDFPLVLTELCLLGVYG